MQVIDTVLAIVLLSCEPISTQEGEITHHKERLALRAVHTQDRFDELRLELHQLGDAGIDLSLKLGDMHHYLLDGIMPDRWGLGHLRELRGGTRRMGSEPIELT
jgi:hypothetical protein